MAEVSIGNAVGAGFHLIRHRPITVMAWGLSGLVTLGVTWGVFGSLYGNLISEALRAGGGTGNSVLSPDVIEQFQRAQGGSLLVSLLGLFVSCVVYCAVFRSVIHPEEHRFAYLRIGAPEMFTLVLAIAGYVGFVFVLVVSTLVIAGLVAAFVAAHAVVVGVVIGVLGGVGLLVGLIYVALRLSLVVPMMVSDGKFHLADAWALTKRHAGALLVIWIALIAFLLIAEIVVALFLFAIGMGYLSSVAGGSTHLQDFFRGSPESILATVAPLLLVLGVIWIPLTGCVYAIVGAPWARVYRDLAGPDLAATFS